LNFALYDYQQEGVEKINALLDKSVKRIAYQLPTRGGKSGVIAKLIEDFAAEKRPVWFIGHTNILLTQMSDDLAFHGIRHGLMTPRAPRIKYRVQVCSKDTLLSRYRRLKESGWPEDPIFIIDECHTARAKGYMEIIKNYPDSIIIGFSATMCRLDGLGLGDIFEELVLGPTPQELEDRGNLCPVDYLVMDCEDDFDDVAIGRNGEFVESDLMEKAGKKVILEDIVSHWEEHALGKKTMTFCINIQHAEDMAQSFTERGYPSVAISSDDGQDVIREKLKKYYSGEYINLCSVDLFTMGFTIKECGCIVLARPTASLMIFLQQIGRGRMPADGKDFLIILDCVNNFDRHGHPNDDREWSLEGKQKKPEIKWKRCSECRRPIPMQAKICPECGFEKEKKPGIGRSLPEEKKGRLVRISERPNQAEKELVVRMAREASNRFEAVMLAEQYDVDEAKALHIWSNTLNNS
jgi:superfamily II DNA or RNA helicase